MRYGDVEHHIAQANNALVFPGLGLAVAVCKASRVSDLMILASAKAVADMAAVNVPGAPLLPAVNQLRTVSGAVALAVCEAAEREGLAQVELEDPVQQVFASMWRPEYAEVVVD